MEKFVVKNERLQSFIGEIQPERYRESNQSADAKERVKLAVQSLMMVPGKTGFSDRAVQEILGIGAGIRRKRVVLVVTGGFPESVVPRMGKQRWRGHGCSYVGPQGDFNKCSLP